MSHTDPRDDHELLKRWETDPAETQKEPPPSFKVKRPPVGAKCARCGSKELSSLPMFSVGSGVAARPFNDDVRCHRCGHIAPPAL